MSNYRPNLPIWAMIILLIAASGCNLINPEDAISERESVIVLFNAAASPLFAFAMDENAAIAFDPNPSLDFAQDDARLIASGTSRTLKEDDIQGTFGEGAALYFFWYLPADTTAEGAVTFRLVGTDGFSYKKLKNQSYQVVYKP